MHFVVCYTQFNIFHQSMLSVGFCYGHGFGVTKDEREAVKLYTLAAEQGYAEAQCNLGEHGGASVSYAACTNWVLLTFMIRLSVCFAQVCAVRKVAESPRMPPRLCAGICWLLSREMHRRSTTWVSR